MPSDEPTATVCPGRGSTHDRGGNGNEGGVEGKGQIKERSGAVEGTVKITVGGDVADTQYLVATLGNKGVDVEGDAGLE